MAYTVQNKQSEKSGNHSSRTNWTKSPESPESMISPESPESIEVGKFSYFKAPAKNTIPYREIIISDLYKVIKGDYFKKQTLYLRSLTDAKLYRKEKARVLDYVTFGGTFSKRSDNALKALSGMMCLDIDHVNNLHAKKRKFIADPFLNVVMVFISPGGDGLKVIITNPYQSGDYTKDYKEVEAYVWIRYGLQIDKTSDVSRACFVCHDPGVWIAEHLLIEEQLPAGYKYESFTRFDGVICKNLINEHGYPAMWDN